MGHGDSGGIACQHAEFPRVDVGTLPMPRSPRAPRSVSKFAAEKKGQFAGSSEVGRRHCPVLDAPPLTIATSRYQAREKIAASGLAHLVWRLQSARGFIGRTTLTAGECVLSSTVLVWVSLTARGVGCEPRPAPWTRRRVTEKA
jgi:hypothetical protein